MAANPQEEFAEDLIENMKDRRPEWQFTLDLEDFSIEAIDAAGTRQAVVRLDKLYAKYSAASSDDERQKVLGDFAKLIVTTGTPELFDDAKKDLMPLIKDRWYVEVLNVSEKLAVSAGKSDGSMFLPSLALTDEICVILSYDMPHVRSLITAGKLKSWDVEFPDAMEIAVQSMQYRTPPGCNGIVYQEDSRPYAYISSWDDASDASRILLEDVMNAFPILGDYVVAMPHAGELVVTGTDEAHGLELLVERFKLAYQHEQRYLPPIPLLWKDKKLSPLKIDSMHPTFHAFQSLKHLWMQDIYTQQKKMLAGEWESLTDGLHVAQFELLEKEVYTGAIMISNCTVPDMGYVLIPQTDLITFCEVDTEGMHTRAVGTWDEVTAILGADLIQMDFYPKLYRVSRFPSATELRSMREAAN